MIDATTQVYCIFGNPVRHSKGPAIHNAWFQAHGINAVYLAFQIDEISKGIDAVKNLNIKGASVTIPFKEAIIPYLDEIDRGAKDMGAVNTIVNRDGKLFGVNTDLRGAVDPLKPFGIRDKTICILGAGGAAQAVACGIHREKGCLVIVNRSRDRGERLASKYDGEFMPMEDLKKIQSMKADILINTTPMGMSPNIEDSAFPARLLDPGMLVMDIVYNPLETKFLRDAKNRGCEIIDGLSMFLHQGSAQFKLWTGITPDLEMMRHTIMNGEF